MFIHLKDITNNKINPSQEKKIEGAVSKVKTALVYPPVHVRTVIYSHVVLPEFICREYLWYPVVLMPSIIIIKVHT